MTARLRISMMVVIFITRCKNKFRYAYNMKVEYLGILESRTIHDQRPNLTFHHNTMYPATRDNIKVSTSISIANITLILSMATSFKNLLGYR